MKYAIVWAVLLVIVILLSAFLYIETHRPYPTPTPTPAPTAIMKVQIIDFSMVDKQWFYLGGTAFDCRFNLTIENKGVSNVTGLELRVKLFAMEIAKFNILDKQQALIQPT